MQNKIKKYFKEFIIFIITLTLVMNIISYYNSLDLNKDKLTINNFKLLDDSNYIVSTDKPLLIHFWASWCPTCKFEAPNIEKISQNYEVITIAVQSGTNEEVKKYLDEHNLTFKVVNDEDGFFSQKFNIKAYPSTFIYDENKNLRFTEVGYTTTFEVYFRMMFIKYFKI